MSLKFQLCLIMQNTISKVPLVLNNSNSLNVHKDYLLSDIQGDVLNISFYKIKKQDTFFQHTMAQINTAIQK